METDIVGWAIVSQHIKGGEFGWSSVVPITSLNGSTSTEGDVKVSHLSIHWWSVKVAPQSTANQSTVWGATPHLGMWRNHSCSLIINSFMYIFYRVNLTRIYWSIESSSYTCLSKFINALLREVVFLFILPTLESWRKQTDHSLVKNAYLKESLIVEVEF